MIGWAGVSDNPPRIAQHVVRARGRSPGLPPHSLIARARGRLSPEDGSSLRSPSFHLASFVPSAFLTVAPAAAQGQANRQRFTRVWRCGDAKATAESGCHLLPQLSPSFAQPAASLARFCVVSQVRSCLTITLRRPFFFLDPPTTLTPPDTLTIRRVAVAVFRIRHNQARNTAADICSSSPCRMHRIRVRPGQAQAQAQATNPRLVVPPKQMAACTATLFSETIS